MRCACAACDSACASLRSVDCARPRPRPSLRQTHPHQAKKKRAETQTVTHRYPLRQTAQTTQLHTHRTMLNGIIINQWGGRAQCAAWLRGWHAHARALLCLVGYGGAQNPLRPGSPGCPAHGSLWRVGLWRCVGSVMPRNALEIDRPDTAQHAQTRDGDGLVTKERSETHSAPPRASPSNMLAIEPRHSSPVSLDSCEPRC